jgi:HK97 family phage major capsid protein
MASIGVHNQTLIFKGKIIMSMNTRGIISMGGPAAIAAAGQAAAPPDAKAVIYELGAAFDEFRSKHVAETKALKEQVAALETFVARSEFKGGGDEFHANARVVAEHSKAFDLFARKGVEAGLRDFEIKASMSTQSDPDGGYAVPTELAKDIVKLETDLSPIRQLATVRPIKTADFKKLVSVGGAASGWVSEVAARPETDNPQLHQIVPPVGEIYANPAVSQVLLDDAGFDLAGWLTEEIATEFAEKEGEAFVLGNGVGRPKGILSYTTASTADGVRAWDSLQYIASGYASTMPDADKLLTLVHSLKAGYRKGASWLMNSSTLEHIRKFKDGEGNYLFRQGLEAGAPSTLLGYPLFEDENMPDIGAGAYPIAFGNWKRAYLIVDRVGIRVLRDPYSNKPFVHFYSTKRVGGAVQDHRALKLLKIAAS